MMRTTTISRLRWIPQTFCFTHTIVKPESISAAGSARRKKRRSKVEVKIFTLYECSYNDTLEDIINRWLKENSQTIKVLQILQSERYGEVEMHNMTITIFFRRLTINETTTEEGRKTALSG